MNTMELVHFVSTGERLPQRATPTKVPYCIELVRPARAAMVRARQYVLSEQRSDGSWLSPRMSDASLASQLIFLLAYRGEERSVLAEQTAAAILAQQAPSGGWPCVPGGPADVSVSVQAYFALKLAGLAASDERLARARIEIRRIGGADAADAISRYFLALFGQIDYECCPAIRPEAILRSRTCAPLLSPLALVWSHRAVRPTGMEVGVRELFIKRPSDWPTLKSSDITNTSCKAIIGSTLISVGTSCLTALLGSSERVGWTTLRTRALQRAEAVLLQSIQPSSIGHLDFGELVWHAIALRASGFSPSSNELQFCEEKLNEFAQVEANTDRLQLQFKDTADADTIAALEALSTSGIVPQHPCTVAGVICLRRRARRNHPRLGTMELSRLLRAVCGAGGARPPSELFPTIQVLHDHSPDAKWRSKRASSHVRRFARFVVQYLIDQQNPDGGWGASDASPKAPDVTAAVLEAIASCAQDRSPRIMRAIAQAVRFLHSEQRADGSWDSATGVRYIHGTSLAVRGLLAAGIERDDDAVAAGVNWLLAHQHSSGGWGELAGTALHERGDEFIAGQATASQTAWAVLALVAAGRSSTEAVRHGVHFLVETQDDGGGWREVPFVHCDVKKHRLFRSELQSAIDPLLALSSWAAALTAEGALEAERAPLRLVSANVDD